MSTKTKYFSDDNYVYKNTWTLCYKKKSHSQLDQREKRVDARRKAYRDFVVANNRF